jgi:hypothetical protein
MALACALAHAQDKRKPPEIKDKDVKALPVALEVWHQVAANNQVIGYLHLRVRKGDASKQSVVLLEHDYGMFGAAPNTVNRAKAETVWTAAGEFVRAAATFVEGESRREVSARIEKDSIVLRESADGGKPKDHKLPLEKLSPDPDVYGLFFDVSKAGEATLKVLNLDKKRIETLPIAMAGEVELEYPGGKRRKTHRLDVKGERPA